MKDFDVQNQLKQAKYKLEGGEDSLTMIISKLEDAIRYSQGFKEYQQRYGIAKLNLRKLMDQNAKALREKQSLSISINKQLVILIITNLKAAQQYLRVELGDVIQSSPYAILDSQQKALDILAGIIEQLSESTRDTRATETSPRDKIALSIPRKSVSKSNTTTSKTSEKPASKSNYETSSKVPSVGVYPQRASHLEAVPKSTIQPICELYNSGVENRDVQREFRDRYKPIRFGVTNAMERRQDLNIAPVFQNAEDGDYYAVETEGLGRGHFAVFPRFDLTLQEFNHGPGAMGKVFVCPNYNSQLRYRSVRVVEPASFAQKGQCWEKIDVGRLDLGRGE